MTDPVITPAATGEWLGRCWLCGCSLVLDATGWPVDTDGGWYCEMAATAHQPEPEGGVSHG